ncbi:hypothetical protein [Mesorhizobium sp. M1273]|uniref:hypothetical protein n=1 Tax=Mesorhizobium sp. M1273 TaxID=2957075 RepID=UPI003335BC79
MDAAADLYPGRRRRGGAVQVVYSGAQGYVVLERFATIVDEMMIVSIGFFSVIPDMVLPLPTAFLMNLKIMQDVGRNISDLAETSGARVSPSLEEIHRRKGSGERNLASWD